MKQKIEGLKSWLVTLAAIFIIAYAAVIWMSPVLFVPGDVDNNGVVDTCDYTMVKLYNYELIDLSFTQRHRADVDRDGDVDEVDYACIREIILGGME